MSKMRTIRLTTDGDFGAVMAELGTVLEELREAAEFTRRGLATISWENGQGVSHATVRNVEQGHVNVTLHTLRAIGLALGHKIEITIS